MDSHRVRVPALFGAGLLFLTLSACSGGGGVMSNPPPASMSAQTQAQTQSGPTAAQMVDTDTLSTDTDAVSGTSILKELYRQTTIGSTVDPLAGEQNPYGLDIAKSDTGLLERGDLVVCNFNDRANVQGTGSTIVALHPHPGATPRRIAKDTALLGCDALALAPNDEIWAAAFSANDNPLISPSGHLDEVLAHPPFDHPFGEAFAAHAGWFGDAAFYVSNAGDGTIVRVGIRPGRPFNIETIAKGFAVNHGVPGSILGPSGLQYDARNDRLYVIDGTNNTVVALCHVSSIPENGITVNASGTSFSGPFAHRGRLIFSGAPLNGPISSALLFNGNLVIGNTLDPNGKNLMVELSARGTLLDVRNVDTGAAGAIFGMVAKGDDLDDTVLYFNDDNANAVEAITR